MNKQILELMFCALAQGYGMDLRPLYTYPVIDGILYFKLLEITQRRSK